MKRLTATTELPAYAHPRVAPQRRSSFSACCRRLDPLRPLRKRSLSSFGELAACGLCGTDLPDIAARCTCRQCAKCVCDRHCVERTVAGRLELLCTQCHEDRLVDELDRALEREVEVLDFHLATVEEDHRTLKAARDEASFALLSLDSHEQDQQQAIAALERDIEAVEREISSALALEQQLPAVLESARLAKVISERRREIVQKKLQKTKAELESNRKQNLLILGQSTELKKAVDKRVPFEFLKTHLCLHCYANLRSVLGEESVSAVQASSTSTPSRRKSPLESPTICCFSHL